MVELHHAEMGAKVFDCGSRSAVLRGPKESFRYSCVVGVVGRPSFDFCAVVVVVVVVEWSRPST